MCAGGVVKGLYRDDERDGPGLFSDSIIDQDDVGFWSREDLVKLCVYVPGVFVVRDHWPLSIDPDEHRLRVTATAAWQRRVGGTGSRARASVDDCPPPDAHLLDARLPADSLAVDRQAFDEAFHDAVVRGSSWRQQLREICVGSCTGHHLVACTPEVLGRSCVTHWANDVRHAHIMASGYSSSVLRWWLSGRAFDLRLTGRGFNSQPVRFHVI